MVAFAFSSTAVRAVIFCTFSTIKHDLETVICSPGYTMRSGPGTCDQCYDYAEICHKMKISTEDMSSYQNCSLMISSDPLE